jgi:phage terminase large subunit-like protein
VYAAPPPGAYGAPPNAYGAPPIAYGPPAAFYEARVTRHVHTLGILWCVFGAYRALAGVVAVLFLMGISTPAFMGGMGSRGMSFLPFAPVMGGLAAVAGVFILFSSCLAFLTGYALMTRKPWGRTIAIVAAILSLIKIFFGTALGIYTLWVLAPTASGMEYDAIADRS